MLSQNLKIILYYNLISVHRIEEIFLSNFTQRIGSLQKSERTIFKFWDQFS